MSINDHNSAVVHSCYYNIKQLRSIHASLTCDAFRDAAYVSCITHWLLHLFYLNLPEVLNRILQMLVNAVAQTISYTTQSFSDSLLENSVEEIEFATWASCTVNRTTFCWRLRHLLHRKSRYHLSNNCKCITVYNTTKVSSSTGAFWWCYSCRGEQGYSESTLQAVRPGPSADMAGEKIQQTVVFCYYWNDKDVIWQRSFPDSNKHALIRLRIKKPALDPLDIKSFRPISNLSFVSKITERLVVDRFNVYISKYHLLPLQQSAYWPYHSTETAVTITCVCAKFKPIVKIWRSSLLQYLSGVHPDDLSK